MSKSKFQLWNRISAVALLIIFGLVLPLSGVFSYTRGRVHVGEPQKVEAATSSYLNMQARLYSSAGNIVPDGYYHVEFKLYNHATNGGQGQGVCSGNCLWTENYTGASNNDRVRVVNGYMSVQLGSETALPDINWDQDLWVTIRVGGNTGTASWDPEMSPRLKLTAVPFAQAAKNVYSGDTSTASTNSDNVSVRTGNATGSSSNSGNITIDVGTATGTAGTISVGTANTSAINIGHVGVTTSIGGNLTVNGNQFTNNGSTLNTANSLGNFASGGSIGTAASTVDVDTSFAIAQTTAGQTLSLPNPTSTTAGRVVFIFNTGSVSFTMHGVTIPAGYGQIYIWNGSTWILGASGGGAAITLQAAYDGGNTILTTDARDIDFTLANTATDANFTVDIATGSTGEFQIEANGTDVLQIGSAGQLQLDVQGSSGGILIGGDTNLYRSAADVLRTSDALTVDGLFTGSLGANISGATINLNASSNNATNINTGTSTGAVSIGNSAAGAIAVQSASTINLTAGTTFSFSGTNATLNTTGQLQLPTTGSTGGLLIGGDANLHRSAAGILRTLSSNNSSTGLQATNDGTGTSALAALFVTSADSNGYVIAGHSGYTPIAILADRFSVYSENTSTGLNLVSNGASGDLRVYTGGNSSTNERLRVTSAGNLGLGDTSPSTRLSIGGTGTANGITLGDDAANPVNLYRGAADILQTDDTFHAVGSIGANLSSANQAWLGATANGVVGPGVAFGSTLDTNLYRSAANTLATDDSFSLLGAGSNLTVQGTGTSTFSGDVAINGGDITTTATTFNLLAGATTALNIGPSGAVGSINLSGGSGDTGCTIDGTTGNLTCTGTITGATGSITLQGAYDGGNTILTTDARDIDFTLANTATDANFTVDIATGSTGEFQIEANGTDVLQIGSAGQLQLDVQGSSGGILIGGDTNLYRSAANTLKTDDALDIGSTITSGAALTVSNNTSTGNVATFKDNNTNVFTIADGGAALLQNSVNSTTAFQIQRSGGGILFTVDTTNSQLSIGSASPANSLLTIGTDTTAATGGITFGTDTQLHRYVANGLSLGVDDTLRVTNTAGDSLRLVADATATYVRAINNSANDWTFASQITGDTAQRLTLETNGLIEWGDGTNPQDTNLFRFGANILQTNDYFRSERAAATDYAFASYVTGDTTAERWRVRADGLMEWGPGGASTIDTNLYRSAANVLATDDSFSLLGAGSNLTVQGTGTSTFAGNLDIAGTLAIGTADAVTIAANGLITTVDDIAINGGDLTTTATTFNLLAGATTALNIGPAGAVGSINLSGGSGDTGCTIDGTTGNLTCTGTITGNGESLSLQGAYDLGNTILTTDARDIDITLANTATDSNFIIDISTGSTGEFQIESNGTDVLQIGAAGQLQLDVQGSTGGILLGTDAQLFRSTSGGQPVVAINASGGLLIDGTGALGGRIGSIGDATTDVSFTTYKTGDAENRFSIRMDGELAWGDGTAARDTNLYRSAANTLKTDDNLLVQTATNSTTALQVQNSAGVSLLQVDTTPDSENLVTNGSFEINTTGWAAKNGSGTSTLTRVTTQQQFGAASLRIATTGANSTNAGATYNVTLANSTNYALSFWAKLNSGTMTDLKAGYSSDGTLGGEVDCTTGNTIVTGGWTNITCTFTTPASNSGTPYIYISQAGATNQTYFVDGVKLRQGTSILDYREGYSMVNGWLGIGTLTPTEALTIQGGSILLDNGEGIRFKDSTGTSRTALSYSTGNNLQLAQRNTSGGNIQIQNDSTTGSIIFYTQGSGNERMRINSAGRVNIGSAGGAATSLLSIDGTGVANGITLGDDQGGPVNLYHSASNVLMTDDALTVAGLLTGQAGATISGGTINLNVSSNNATNINTGTSTGAVAIGNSATSSFTLESGTGTVNLFNGATAHTLQLATSSSAAQSVTIGSTNSGSTNIFQGGTAGNQMRADGTTAFRIQSANGSTTVFNADVTNTRITIGAGAGTLSNRNLDVAVAEITSIIRVGTSSNGISFNDTGSTNGAANKFRLSGTARNSMTATLSPEFPGATLSGDGTSNTGTMTSDFCSNSSPAINTGVCTNSGERQNYYSWTAQATNDYDVWVRWQVPSNFGAWEATNPIQFYGWRSSSSSGTSVTMTIYSASGSVCGTATSISNTTSWALTNYSSSGCSPSAGDVLTFRITLSVGVNNEFARIGEIKLNYLSIF